MSLRVVFLGTSSKYSLVPLQRIAEAHNVVAIVESGERNCSDDHLSFPAKVMESVYALTGQPSLWWYARNHRLPHFYFCRGYEKELAAFMQQLAPDLGCIASFNHLLPAEIIHIPRHGIINFHPSLLPKYRGPNVWFWFYHEMEREGGATIHFIDEKEDSGDILKQASFPIRLGMAPQELRQRTIELGSELLSATLTEIENDTARPAPQHHLQCPQRGRLIKPGEQLFPWSEWDIERVYHFLVGAHPWYRALQGKHGVLGNLPWKAVGYNKCTIAAPGRVKLDQGGAYFAHPQGKVRLQLAVSGVRIAFWLIMAAMLIFAWLLCHVISSPPFCGG